VRQSQIGTYRLFHRHVIAGDEQIGPAVVIVVEEPGGEGMSRPKDASLPGDVGERAIAVVMVKRIVPPVIGGVKVHVTDVVVIRRYHRFRVCHTVDAGGM
jgi:hypothetical protein